MNLLFNSDVMNLLLKNRRPKLLFWSSLIVDGDVVRLGRWERWNVGVVWKVGGWWVGKWDRVLSSQGKPGNNTFFKKSGKNKGKKQNYDKVREKSGNF